MHLYAFTPALFVCGKKPGVFRHEHFYPLQSKAPAGAGVPVTFERGVVQNALAGSFVVAEPAFERLKAGIEQLAEPVRKRQQPKRENSHGAKNFRSPRRRATAQRRFSPARFQASSCRRIRRTELFSLPPLSISPGGGSTLRTRRSCGGGDGGNASYRLRRLDFFMICPPAATCPATLTKTPRSKTPGRLMIISWRRLS